MVGDDINSLQRSSRYILQPQPSGQSKNFVVSERLDEDNDKISSNMLDVVFLFVRQIECFLKLERLMSYRRTNLEANI